MMLMKFFMLASLMFSFAVILYRIVDFISHKVFIKRRLNEGDKRLKVNLQAQAMVKQISKDNIGMLGYLDRKLIQAGLDIPVNKFLIGFGLVVLIGFLVLFSFKVYNFAFLYAVGLPVVTIVILNYLKKRHIQIINNQLPDAINFLSSSLKSGYSLMHAIKLLSLEKLEISKEFQQVINDINIGKSYEAAFDRFAEKNPIDGVKIISTAVVISLETGGNLGHLLETVAENLMEQEKIRGHVKSLSAQGRLSGVILSLLPIVISLFIYVVNPNYISALFTNAIGRQLLAVGLAGQVIGIFIISRIVKIEW